MAKTNENLKLVMTWTIASGAVVLVVGGMVAFSIFGYARLYENRIFPGVRILNIRLDGLTESEARTTVYQAIDAALKDGLRFSYDGREITLPATTIAQEDPDASSDLIRYDIDDAVAAAYTYGRSESILRDTFARWRARVRPVHLEPDILIDEEAISAGIQSATKETISEVTDASLDVTWNATTKGAETNINAEKAGREIQFEIALEMFKEQADALQFAPIPLHDVPVDPTIRTTDIEPLLPKVDEVMTHVPLTMTFEEESYEVTPQIFASWIGVYTDGSNIQIGIHPEKFKKGIRELAPIEVVAKKGSLAIEDGKVKSFEAGTEGITIDDAATLAEMTYHWDASSTFPIHVTHQKPALDGTDPERLGIQEILGIGRSDFSGSPTNRRKNIALGVSLVNGSLIPPGEEFSLLQTLGGNFTAAAGWLPELVIKGSETVPEYGGGLCQIGTTTFRAALQSGLKITQRRNHSYRVRYYEPAGTDATIYDPAPDFRFINDTDHHVYIHAYIAGNEVIYEFWGTSDGRQAIVDEPRIFNIVAPPPKKIIETLELPPGQTRCTESAHAGADAALDYKVEYADGTIHEETFRSHYRPWQAVCLVGVEKLSEDIEGAHEEGDAELADSNEEASSDVSMVQE